MPPALRLRTTKVYDGTSAFVVTNHGVIDPNNVLAGDTVYHTALVNAPTSNQTNGFSTQLNISFHTYGPQGGNYVILDTVDVLWGSISKLALYITDPSIRTIKEYDGTNIAEVVTPAIPLNLVEGDSITITTTATYDDAEVGFEKPITIHHDLPAPKATTIGPADTIRLLDPSSCPPFSTPLLAMPFMQLSMATVKATPSNWPTI